MPFFPQLQSGAVVQYPHGRRIVTRSVINRCHDGRDVRLYDADARMLAWDLAFSSLSWDEAAALESFFESVEGRLKPFTWLDPTGNLLSSSEDVSATPWVADPLLTVTGGQQGPLSSGQASRLSNASQSVQRVAQSVPAPASFTYCFSAWVRSGASAAITLSIEAGGLPVSHTITPTSTWTRSHVAGRLESGEEQVTFSIALAPGNVIELFGAQAEPQPSPGPYRRTVGNGGVYPGARFDQDWLLMEAAAPDAYRTAVRILTPFQG